MAAARLYDSGMSARLAAISARTTFGHVAAGQVVGLQAPGRHAVLLAEARLQGHDLRADDDVRVHLAERHADQLDDADVGLGDLGLDPEVEILREEDEREQGDEGDERRGQIRSSSPLASSWATQRAGSFGLRRLVRSSMPRGRHGAAARSGFVGSPGLRSRIRGRLRVGQQLVEGLGRGASRTTSWPDADLDGPHQSPAGSALPPPGRRVRRPSKSTTPEGRRGVRCGRTGRSGARAGRRGRAGAGSISSGSGGLGTPASHRGLRPDWNARPGRQRQQHAPAPARNFRPRVDRLREARARGSAAKARRPAARAGPPTGRKPRRSAGTARRPGEDGPDQVMLIARALPGTVAASRRLGELPGAAGRRGGLVAAGPPTARTLTIGRSGSRGPWPRPGPAHYRHRPGGSQPGGPDTAA